MPLLRRFLLVLVALSAVAGFASSRALALPPTPTCSITLPNALASAHFVVHYTTDSTDPAYITATEAGSIAAAAEHAYDAYAALGLPAPVTNPADPGMIDINVMDLSTWKVSYIYCDGAFDFEITEARGPNQLYDEGTAVFEQIERGAFSAHWGDGWLTQGAAAWASWKSLGYPAESTSDVGPYEVSLDCFSDDPSTTLNPTSKCSKVPYEDGADSRWPFYEYLAERFGTSFIVEVLQDAQTAHSAALGLQNALVAHGTTVTAAYNAYATKLVAGGWAAPSLNVSAPTISGEPIMTGINTGDLPPVIVSLNHLATRYVEIDRGDGAADHACFAATLTITVQIPAGVTSQPAFYWNGGTSAVDLAVAGNTATTTVPWDTCKWTNKGFLSLPNATTNLDSRQFSVSEHLTVNTNAPANAKVPPAPATPFGAIINVPTSGLVPAISVFGPELLTLSVGATQIRLIVESSGEGSVEAALGGLGLGSSTVRPGENDLRFAVPAGTLAALRRVAATGALTLTLTPTSIDGTATGPAVLQQISVAPAKQVAAAKQQASSQAKAKAKAAAKAKAKTKGKTKGKTKIATP